jgi:hypothetical protein
MMLGTPEHLTHEDIRAGPLNLFAALAVAGPTAGRVTTQLHPQHRAIEFRRFLVAIDRSPARVIRWNRWPEAAGAVPARSGGRPGVGDPATYGNRFHTAAGID